MLDILTLLEFVVGIFGGLAWLFEGFTRSPQEKGYTLGIIIRLIVLGILIMFACIVIEVLRELGFNL